ncbi:hypothetical protein UVI_02042760 [Ustilaginoidea virens]|uniref:Uncharacterized protein n=1 Tax=Ustilaginoidea virens TaxID=1159556 RepID=A0A1B5L637_USTVR|nr:hypothetical protein UVI_02042760 [Ustilaginoidea virens]
MDVLYRLQAAQPQDSRHGCEVPVKVFGSVCGIGGLSAAISHHFGSRKLLDKIAPALTAVFEAVGQAVGSAVGPAAVGVGGKPVAKVRNAVELPDGTGEPEEAERITYGPKPEDAAVVLLIGPMVWPVDRGRGTKIKEEVVVGAVALTAACETADKARTADILEVARMVGMEVVNLTKFLTQGF